MRKWVVDGFHIDANGMEDVVWRAIGEGCVHNVIDRLHADMTPLHWRMEGINARQDTAARVEGLVVCRLDAVVCGPRLLLCDLKFQRVLVAGDVVRGLCKRVCVCLPNQLTYGPLVRF